ncbi:MAG: AAA family ATPase [Waddliaceae bacterium]
MSLIKELKLKNFKCFRKEEVFSFDKLTYLVGVNNAGKTAALHGILFFFDDNRIEDGSFLNRQEFTRKQTGYNRTEITILFDLGALTTKTRKKKLIKNYGKQIYITKLISYTPQSGIINVAWAINEDKEVEELPKDIRWLLDAVKVTYIHPQEGKKLLKNVQTRLRQRLLANWGRGAALTHNLKELEKKWGETRSAANKYLSKSLTDSVQPFWPNSKVTIVLPKSIKELINIADIGFQGESSLPEIELTSQGTGAQSTILYLAHYLLDSDRSLNKGEYHPVWLMEEPESFLHADLLAKFSKQLNSEKWLQDIQMIISSHSPILMAASRAVGSWTRWTILDDYKVEESVLVSDTSESFVEKMGFLMGDNNFSAYFAVAENNPLTFIEDERKQTIEALCRSNINITKGLGGIAQVDRFLDVIKSTPEFIRSKVYFIVDGDTGLSTIARHIKGGDAEAKSGFKKYKCDDAENVFVVQLPEKMIIEDLFDEYEDHLLNCISQIWDDDFNIRGKIPTRLSRVTSKARNRTASSKKEQEEIIKNEQDIKDLFWDEVEKEEYQINKGHQKILSLLLED